MTLLIEVSIFSIVLLFIMAVCVAHLILFMFSAGQVMNQNDEYSGRKGRWKLKRAAWSIASVIALFMLFFIPLTLARLSELIFPFLE